MADIKKFSKSIKKFDNARYSAEKINTAVIQSKKRINKSISIDEGSPEEYAAERVNENIERVADDSAYLANCVGKKATENTIENYKKYKANKQIREFNKNQKESTECQVVLDTPKHSESYSNGAKNVKGTKAVKDAKSAEKVSAIASKKAYQTKENIKNVEKSGKAIKEGAKKTAEFIKKTAKATKKTVMAIIEGGKALVSAIIAGGWVSAVIIILICLVAAVAVSVYGIFFSSEDSGTRMTINSVIQEINNDYENEIDKIKAENDYDTFEINGSRANWKDVLAIYSVKTTTDTTSPKQVATVDENTKNLLSSIFWDMNVITSKVNTRTETKETEVIDEDGNKTTVVEEVAIKALDISIKSKTATEMAAVYGFTDEQKAYLNDLIDDKNNDLWNSLIFGLNMSGSNIDIGSITFEGETVNDTQKKIVAVATNSEKYGISARSGYCEAWVKMFTKS